MDTFSKLSRTQKIEQLRLLRSRLRGDERGGGPDHPPVTGLRLAPDPAGRYQPFPLTDLQESFLTGRRLAAARSPEDQVGCHLYCEIDVADLDVERLERAWRRLVERHDMLRAVVSRDGTQRVQEQVPAYRIAVEHLGDASDGDARRRAGEIRQALSHKIYQPGEWPLFEVRVTALPGAATGSTSASTSGSSTASASTDCSTSGTRCTAIRTASSPTSASPFATMRSL